MVNVFAYPLPLQDYVAMVNLFVPMGVSSSDFLLGQCYLSKGEVYEVREYQDTVPIVAIM